MFSILCQTKDKDRSVSRTKETRGLCIRAVYVLLLWMEER